MRSCFLPVRFLILWRHSAVRGFLIRLWRNNIYIEQGNNVMTCIFCIVMQQWLAKSIFIGRKECCRMFPRTQISIELWLAMRYIVTQQFGVHSHVILCLLFANYIISNQTWLFWKQLFNSYSLFRFECEFVLFWGWKHQTVSRERWSQQHPLLRHTLREIPPWPQSFRGVS